MEYQTTNNIIKINKDKNIGKVLYIVEGSKREFILIRHLFTRVLGYVEVYGVNREGREYKTYSGTEESNSNTKVYIINTETSCLGSITDTNSFIKKQIDEINMAGFDIDYENIPIYYIFDCDRDEDCKKAEFLVKELNNAMEGKDFNSIGGMLLLSYPNIEAFILSLHEKDIWNLYINKKIEQTMSLKEYIDDKGYSDKKIELESISKAFEEMMNSMSNLGIEKFDIDNFSDTNFKIFSEEKKKRNMHILSLFLLSFLYIGILECISYEKFNI